MPVAPAGGFQYDWTTVKCRHLVRLATAESAMAAAVRALLAMGEERRAQHRVNSA